MVKKLLNQQLPTHWVSSCGRYHVSIATECIRDMLTLCRKHLPREIGASVYGTYSSDGFHASVLGNSPITLDSVSERCSFHRGVEGASRFFMHLFRKTQGRQHYVGEWHSHPGGPPEPSATDNRTLHAIASDSETNCPECILLLVGGDLRSYPKIGVYVYSRERGRVDLLPDATPEG